MVCSRRRLGHITPPASGDQPWSGHANDNLVHIDVDELDDDLVHIDCPARHHPIDRPTGNLAAADRPTHSGTDHPTGNLAASDITAGDPPAIRRRQTLDGHLRRQRHMDRDRHVHLHRRHMPSHDSDDHPRRDDPNRHDPRRHRRRIHRARRDRTVADRHRVRRDLRDFNGIRRVTAPRSE